MTRLLSEKVLTKAFQEMWSTNEPCPHTVARSTTLARLVRHARQLEKWWQCELAAHLWDYVGQIDEEGLVWIEAHARADIALARGRPNRNGVLTIVTQGPHVVIPIELKTVGTFWGSSNIEKAYREAGKKRLEHDMRDARDGVRAANPFSVVGLLITHMGARDDGIFDLYRRRARELGGQHGLVRVLDEAIPLPSLDDGPCEAHQLVWTTAVSSTS